MLSLAFWLIGVFAAARKPRDSSYAAQTALPPHPQEHHAGTQARPRRSCGEVTEPDQAAH
jgi:hypothetical protein